MVALCINKETLLKGMIVPTFTNVQTGAAYKGEAVSPFTVLSLRAGRYDDKHSTFTGFEIAQGETK